MQAAVPAHLATQSTSQPIDHANWTCLSDAALGFARLWCDRREDAEDVAQEALMDLFRAESDVKSPLSWLFVVTRRLATRSRGNESERRHGVQALKHETPSAVPSPLGRVAVLNIVMASRNLSIRDRRLLAWAVLGYTHSEIAHRLDCSRADVGQYMARATKRLLASLECR